MKSNTTKWRVPLLCDDCEYEIADPPQAKLIWESLQPGKVKIVHAPLACERWRHYGHALPGHITDRRTMSLGRYLGPLGLLELLACIQRGDLPVEMGLEVIRRLHVPGYEEYCVFRAENPEYGLPANPDRADFEAFLVLRDPHGDDEYSS
jgi:hypothetical protein